MRHQAVMGVVAVACVAVVSAPMLGARGGVHHRGGRPAERHQYLAGVDFTADPVAAAAAAALARPFVDTGALMLPDAPPTTPDDGGYSPFIGITPPSFGPLRAALRQPPSLDRAPPEAPPGPTAPPAQTRGLIQAIGEETPETPDPPVPPPEPPVTTPDDPPPVIVVTPVTPVTPVETVTPPPQEPPPAPVLLVQAPPVATPTAIPEPQTWVMLLLGFAAVGATIRRRRDGPVAKECR
jgi:hypothetical protein